MTASAFPQTVTGEVPSSRLRRASVRVDRCLTELRRGRAVRITDAEGAVVAAAVETLGPELLRRLSTTGACLAIAVTEEREGGSHDAFPRVGTRSRTIGEPTARPLTEVKTSYRSRIS